MRKKIFDNTEPCPRFASVR